MNNYRYLEHGVGYRVNKTLQPWRPQFSIILSLIKNGSHVLDVGCGDGVLGELLIKKKKCTVKGVEVDEVGVKKARKRGIDARVLDINEGLPFKRNSFDVVVCNEVLQYIDNPDFVVSETLRVGKKVIIAFPNFGFWAYRLEHLLGRFPKLSLYGHTWWETNQTKFFSLSDFLDLPSLQKVRIKKLVCIDWKNREVSLLAKINPNFFGRSCILELEPTNY